MATTGPVFPQSAESVAESPWLDNAWNAGTEANIISDNGVTAIVNAATFDAADQTTVLKAYNFDFSSIPDGSTIDGVIVVVNNYWSAGTASMDLLQLLNTSRAKVGTNQCSTAVVLTNSTSNLVTKGSSSDLWGNALTSAWVKNPNFGVAIGNLATAANTDVEIDYVTIEIFYTPPPVQLSSASISDADRNWDTLYQDVALSFNESVDITPAPSIGDTIAGLTAQVNGGVSVALTYVSGNGTSSWKVRLSQLIQQNDTIVLDYDQVSGAILAVDDNAEIEAVVDLAVTNSLTKRIREVIQNKDNSVLNAVTVKYSIHSYDSGAPANANWMTRQQKGTQATDANGLLDIAYTGSDAIDSTIYLVIIHPNATPTESLIWTTTVK